MRTQSITAKDPGQNPVMNYQYTYDRMDNIVSKVTKHGEYAYGYDDLYRLASADNPIQDNEAFTYDPVGNRLTSSDTTGTWSYNDNNELNAHNNTSYEYDENGNMAKKTIGGVVTNFIYNVEDRLIEVRDGSDSLIASYYYDPFGRRLWKEAGGTKTYFLYADEGLIGEYGSTGAEIKTYGYKPGSTWTTDPLFMKQGVNYYFYQNDNLGTPQKITAVNGAVVWSAKYSSFGKANIKVNTIENNLRFPGQYYDQETGLHYNYHRYYDPGIGRYMKADPIGMLEGYVAQKNINHIYLYSSANPTNLIDPLGLADCYNYTIVSVDFIRIKVLKKEGECPWGWIVASSLEENKDEFIGEKLIEECEKGTCQNITKVNGVVRTLSDVVRQTFWWEGWTSRNYTLDESIGTAKGWKKCTMTVRANGTGIVDRWEGTCCENGK